MIRVLCDNYSRVNTNNDSHIDEKEISEWIRQKVKEHFENAKEQNGRVFHSIDSDKDGKMI